MRVARISTAIAMAGLSACGAPQEDNLRTVKSYDYAMCDSAPTTDATQLAALEAFRSEVQNRYFVRRQDSHFAANHEADASSSGLREYQGPFYVYFHSRPLERNEQGRGIDAAAMVFLHAAKVRSRTNGQEWGEWNSVRTRNFAQEGRAVEGLSRWKCLLGAEIAWADLIYSNGKWTVTPLAVGVYEKDEVRRSLPTPSQSQIDGKEAIETL
jgi:hypothetical protein